MKKILHRALPLTLIALLLGSACAQEAPPEVQSVDIVGIKNPQVIPYATMRKGEEAFKKHHALAPAASLRFGVGSKEKSSPLGELDLRLRSDDQSVRIPVENMSFVLPDASEINLEKPELVVVNRPRDSVGWRPVVRSPNLLPNTLRLGDLRLMCEVGWSMFLEDAPFLKRMAIKLSGMSCNNKNFTFNYTFDASVKSVALVAGERRIPLEMSASRNVIVPLRDASWPDDSLIVSTLESP